MIIVFHFIFFLLQLFSLTFSFYLLFIFYEFKNDKLNAKQFCKHWKYIYKPVNYVSFVLGFVSLVTSVPSIVLFLLYFVLLYISYVMNCKYSVEIEETTIYQNYYIKRLYKLVIFETVRSVVLFLLNLFCLLFLLFEKNVCKIYFKEVSKGLC